MIRFLMLISRQGKCRLTKWYLPYPRKQKDKMVREVTNQCLERPSKLCNFLEWRDGKIIYKRYASLYFIVMIDNDDNELMALEIIHHFVEVLDRYFTNVCELDLIFNFHKAYYILDEVLLAGELQETSKKAILQSISSQDMAVEEERDGGKNKKGGKPKKSGR